MIWPIEFSFFKMRLVETLAILFENVRMMLDFSLFLSVFGEVKGRYTVVSKTSF